MVRFIIAAMIWATASSAQAQHVGSAQQGLRVARETCAQCHLVDKVVGHSTNANAPTFEALAKSPGLTSAALALALQTSHRTMPNVVIKGREQRRLLHRSRQERTGAGVFLLRGRAAAANVDAAPLAS
jgi:mono/diheme cytochrome c family protein